MCVVQKNTEKTNKFAREIQKTKTPPFHLEHPITQCETQLVHFDTMMSFFMNCAAFVHFWQMQSGHIL